MGAGPAENRSHRGLGVEMRSLRTRLRTLPAEPHGGVVIAKVLTPAKEPVDSPWRQWLNSARKVGVFAVHLAIAICAIGVTTLSGSGGVARAEISPCIDDPTYNTWGPEQVRSGIDGMIDQTGPAGTYDQTKDPLPQQKYVYIDEAIADTEYTDYEKLGTAGTVFSVDYGSEDEDDNACFPLEKAVGNFLANQTFNVAKMISRLAISTYQWSASDDMFEPLNEPLDEITGSMWSGGVKGLVGAAIAFGVIVLLWRFKKRRASLVFGGVVWMVVSLFLLLLFVAKPSALPSAINGVVRDVSTFALSNTAASATDEDPHVKATYEAVAGTPNGGQRIASDMLWRVLVFTPWLSGQWGVSGPEPILMQTTPYPPDTPEGWYDGTRDARYQQLYSQACVIQAAVACDQFDQVPNAPDIPDFFQYARNWYMVQNWTCQSADYCIGPTFEDGSDNDDDREVDSSNGWGYRAVWSGDQPGQRNMAALTAVVASGGLGVLVFILAAMTVAYGLIIYVVAFLGQFLGVLGIIPGGGQALLMSVGSFLLGTALKRIAVGLLMSVLIVVYQVIMVTGFGWFAQIGLMLGMTVAVLLLRGPLTTALTSLMPGNGGGAFSGADDALNEKVQRAGHRTVDAGKTVTKRTVKAPAVARRSFLGMSAATRAAQGEIDKAAEGGVAVPQRRTKLAAALRGFKAGAGADDRYEAHRRGASRGRQVAGTEASLQEARDARKFGRTEHGRADEMARQVRTGTKFEQARQRRLASTDESIRIAAQVDPKRFRSTPRNFDGYDSDGNARYVDRNTRKREGKTPKHSPHSRQAGVPLRGADPAPRPTRAGSGTAAVTPAHRTPRHANVPVTPRRAGSTQGGE